MRQNAGLKSILTNVDASKYRYLRRNPSNLSNHAVKENDTLGQYYEFLDKNTGVYGSGDPDNRRKLFPHW